MWLGEDQINKARAFVSLGRREDAITEYCDAFFTRLDDLEDDTEFIFFYREKMGEYFKEKKNLFISLPEGDMVSDLIRMTYLDFMDEFNASPFKKTRKGFERLLMDIRIVFPVQNDTYLEDERAVVSK